MAPRSRAQLRVVGGTEPAPPATPTIEDELAELFGQEADLVRALAQVRTHIYAARERFAKANGLRALPRYELLRARFTPRSPTNG